MEENETVEDFASSCQKPCMILWERKGKAAQKAE